MADTKFTDYKVADMSLADWGRKEIAIAEMRNARPDGHPRRIRRHQAAGRRPHRRFPAHDHPDRGADRDPAGAGRPGALGLLQHLLDPGPRRRRHRRRRHAGVRLQGRVPGRVLGIHPPHFRMARRARQHDPGRRRRRHPAAAPGHPRRVRSLLHRQPHLRGRARAVRLHQGQAGDFPRLVLRPHPAHQGRDRGNHHRRAPPVPDGRGRPPEVPGHQRQRLGHQVQVRQPVRLPRIPAGRHQARHRRDDRRQDLPWCWATATWARAAPRPSAAWAPP